MKCGKASAGMHKIVDCVANVRNRLLVIMLSL